MMRNDTTHVQKIKAFHGIFALLLPAFFAFTMAAPCIVSANDEDISYNPSFSLLAQAQENQKKNTKKVEFGEFETDLIGGSVDAFAKGGSGFLGLTNLLVGIITGFIVVIGVIIVVVGGYMYMTARGDADQVRKAKELILAALIGILIALTSVIILNTINPQLGGQAENPL